MQYFPRWKTPQIFPWKRGSHQASLNVSATINSMHFLLPGRAGRQWKRLRALHGLAQAAPAPPAARGLASVPGSIPVTRGGRAPPAPGWRLPGSGRERRLRRSPAHPGNFGRRTREALPRRRPADGRGSPPPLGAGSQGAPGRAAMWAEEATRSRQGSHWLAPPPPRRVCEPAPVMAPGAS